MSALIIFVFLSIKKSKIAVCGVTISGVLIQCKDGKYVICVCCQFPICGHDVKSVLSPPQTDWSYHQR